MDLWSGDILRCSVVQLHKWFQMEVLLSSRDVQKQKAEDRKLSFEDCSGRNITLLSDETHVLYNCTIGEKQFRWKETTTEEIF